VSIDSIVWLDPEITVDGSLRGRSFDVVIAGRPTTLTLPLSGPRAHTVAGSGPPSQVPEFPPPPLATSDKHGQITATISMPVPETWFAIEALRLQWSDPEFIDSIRRSRDHTSRSMFEEVSGFSADVGAWLATVRGWLAAWYQDVRRPPTVAEDPRVRLVIVDDLDAGAFWAGGGTLPQIVIRKMIDGDHLAAAFAAASKGRAVPVEHSLLIDSRLHMLQHEFRFAVINACTAAEVAMSQTVRARLLDAGLSQSQAGQILASGSGIADLYRLAATFFDDLGVSRKRVIDQLGDPRNRAAHAGELLDLATAKKARETAAALLEAVSPLPTAEQLLASE
jgi:hypothetical protein